MNILHLADVPASYIINTPAAFAQGPSGLPELLNNIFHILTYAIGVIAVVMIIFTGFTYITSVGNPQKTKKALQSVIYTAVGFAVAVLARSIIEFALPKVSGKTDVPGVITDGINTFLWVTGIAALIIIIVAGILYATSIGEPQKTKTAKDAILYAVVGLIVALLAGAMITALNTFLATGHL